MLEVRPTEDVDPTITQTTVAQAVKELFAALQAWKMAKQAVTCVQDPAAAAFKPGDPVVLAPGAWELWSKEFPEASGLEEGDVALIGPKNPDDDILQPDDDGEYMLTDLKGQVVGKGGDDWSPFKTFRLMHVDTIYRLR